MSEKDFEREVLDRLAVIETKLDPLLTNSRDYNKIIGQHSVAIAENSASAKSAHHRIDGIHKSAGLIAAVISGIFTLINFILRNGGG